MAKMRLGSLKLLLGLVFTTGIANSKDSLSEAEISFELISLNNAFGILDEDTREIMSRASVDCGDLVGNTALFQLCSQRRTLAMGALMLYDSEMSKAEAIMNSINSILENSPNPSAGTREQNNLSDKLGAIGHSVDQLVQLMQAYRSKDAPLAEKWSRLPTHRIEQQRGHGHP